MLPLLTALLLFGALRTAAQSVIRFDDASGSWHVARTFAQGSQELPNFAATTTSLFFFSGDSMINGATWQRLFSTGAAGTAPLLRGYVLQAGHLVLYLEPGLAVDTLYDFSLEVGAPMHFGRAGSDFRDTLTVEAIDHITIEGMDHRIFHFSTSTRYMTMESYLSDIWIEGIGSIHGPLAPLHAGSLEDWYPSGLPDSTRLTCYNQHNAALWQHTGYPDCVVNIQQALHEQAAERFRVFPNPASGSFTVESGHEGVATIKIIDVLGQVVLQTSASGTRYQVDTRTIKPGLYWMQITTRDKPVQMARVVVQ